MVDTLSGKPTDRCLTVNEKVSIVNALMAEDRTEVRELQEAVFRLTYYMIPGLIAVAAFSVKERAYTGVLVLGEILLLALYVVAFFTFRRWLADARACQKIREAFYKDPTLWDAEPFEPIRPIEHKDRRAAFRDNTLWFPFGVTIATGVVLIGYMASRI